MGGIISQWGKTAIHKTGYRSQYVKIDFLFNIRESDAQGASKFIEWINIFNQRIKNIADKYHCQVISWQDFIESENRIKSLTK